MKEANLVNFEKSDIKLQLSSFPDGQQQIKVLSGVAIGDQATIKCRLNNFKDLEVLICTVKSLNGIGIDKISLYVPYFLGSRSDRQFEFGSNNYLKDVICPIINSLSFRSVQVLRPHSDVLEALLTNFCKADISGLLINKLISDHSLAYSNVKIISPDAGTYKWINAVVRDLDFSPEIIQAYKERNQSTGEIINTKFIGQVEGKDCFIIDDIIDGGRSFVEIAKHLKLGGAKSIWLVIHHGIFSAGFDVLSESFDGIYCTNSYSDIDNNLVKQINVF